MTDSVIDMGAALKARVTDIKQKLNDALAANADMKTINALTRDLAAARKAVLSITKMADEDDDDPQQASQDMEILKADIRLNVLGQYDYYYVNDQEKFVLYTADDNRWTYNTPRGMSAVNAKLIPNTDYYNLFMDVLKEDNRWFLTQTASLSPTPRKLNRLRYEPLQPIAEPHHPLFDLVIRGMCGDKAENIEHVEQVVVSKWANPGNFMLPVLCFSDGGATGKSLFVSTILTALFGEAAVASNCVMSDFAGQFNGHLCGKLVIMVNENCEDSYNHNRMKMIAASPKVSFCNKGQMPFDADNTALLIVTGNSIAGSIRVDGGDVDRRFSVIRATKKLSHYTAPYLSQTLGKPVTIKEAEAWIVAEGQHILKDPNEVAKWLNSLVVRHGKPKHVPALHGADYQMAVATQKPLVIQVFEAVFGQPGFDYVRKPLVFEFYRSELLLQGNTRGLGKTKFYEMLNQWLKTNHPHITHASVNWGSSSAEVYVDGSMLGGKTRPKLMVNDTAWFDMPPYGDKKLWKVAI